MLCALLLQSGPVGAITVSLFDHSQPIVLTSSSTTSDTYQTEGYLITATRDKLFTGGVDMTDPIGRSIRVPWPDGMEAQAVTTGPNPAKARIMIERVDGQPFDIAAFTAKLLGNTAGAGASLEIMPMTAGEDAFSDPAMFDASGYYGISFSYSPTQLSGFDSYKITLYVDFALTSLTLTEASPPPPSSPQITPLSGTTFRISWPVDGYTHTLETSTDLSAGSWSTVDTAPVVEGPSHAVSLELPGPVNFFRLRN